MKFHKTQVLDLLRQQGEHDKAEQADRELPAEVDTEEHAGLLGRLGVNPRDLSANVIGPEGIGGMLDGR